MGVALTSKVVTSFNTIGRIVVIQLSNYKLVTAIKGVNMTG